MIDIWLNINEQKIDLFFMSHHFLPISLMDFTCRVVIFSLQSRFCFNIDIDLKSMDLPLKFNEEVPRTVRGCGDFHKLIFFHE